MTHMIFLGLLALVAFAVFGLISFLAADVGKPVMAGASLFGCVGFFMLAILLFQGVDFVASFGFERQSTETVEAQQKAWGEKS